MSPARNSIRATRPHLEGMDGNYTLPFSWFFIFYHNLVLLFVSAICPGAQIANWKLRKLTAIKVFSPWNRNPAQAERERPPEAKPEPETWTIWLTVRVIIIFFKSVCANFSLCQSFVPFVPPPFACFPVSVRPQIILWKSLSSPFAPFCRNFADFFPCCW